jgi:hypothetical protein
MEKEKDYGQTSYYPPGPIGIGDSTAVIKYMLEVRLEAEKASVKTEETIDLLYLI